MFVLITLVSIFLLGSIPTGLIIAYLYYDLDPRTAGSQNIGMTNIWRLLGWKPALFTLAGDLGKGMISIWWMTSLTSCTTYISWAALAVTLGHCYSVYLKFSGGKGVATVGGVLFALQPYVFFFLAGVWLVSKRITQKSSLSALLSATLLIPLSVVFLSEYVSTVVLLVVLIFWRHKSNIHRLRQGTE